MTRNYKHPTLLATMAGTMSVFGYFLHLLFQPTTTIPRISHEKPSWVRIAVFLFWVATLRWLLELIWELVMAGQLRQTFLTPVLLKRQIVSDGMLFFVGHLTTVYLRWAMFALIAYLGSRVLGRRVRFDVLLRLYGIALGLFVVTVLPNYLYVFFSLPLLRFEVSEIYTPVVGIGQLLSALWLIVISSKILRSISGLSWFESILVSLLIPLTNFGLLVLCAWMFFNLPAIIGLPQREMFLIAAWCFIPATLLATPLLLWAGREMNERRPKSSATNIGERCTQ